VLIPRQTGSGLLPLLHSQAMNSIAKLTASIAALIAAIALLWLAKTAAGASQQRFRVQIIHSGLIGHY